MKRKRGRAAAASAASPDDAAVTAATTTRTTPAADAKSSSSPNSNKKKPATAAAAKRKATATTSSSPANNKSKSPAKKKTKKNSACNVMAAKTTTKSTKIAAKAAPPPPPPPPAPTNTLIIDNGGDTIKYGWNRTNDVDEAAAVPVARSIPNRTARLQQQWTVLVGDELISKVKNPSQLVGVTGSTERGVVTNLGNQIQVWKRVLDELNVQVPVHTDTARAFGWATKPAAAAKKNKKKRRKKVATRTQNDDDGDDGNDGDDEGNTSSTIKILPGQCAVLLALQPFCPRVVLDSIANVWFSDFGFARVGFCTSQVVCALLNTNDVPTTSTVPDHPPADDHDHDHDDYMTCLVVDIGWSSIHVCPTYRGKPISSNSIRRLPFGGKHLINIWKYWTSYRQYNLMDQEYILRDVLEKTAYVTLDYDSDMGLARKLSGGRRPYDREYVLPDYQNTFEGRVRLPAALEKQKQRDEEEDADEEEEDDDEEEDSDVDEEEMMKEAEAAEKRAEEEGSDGSSGGSDDDEEEEEEESAEQIRRRVMNRRAEEERQRREMEQQQQILNISTERFVIPETLFRPTDAGLPADWVGLPTAIVQSIQACPKPLQPALYQSIQLVGGLSQLPGLHERLEKELRTLAPCEYDVKIRSHSSSATSADEKSSSSSPVNQAWYGACQFSKTVPYDKWSISKMDWDSNNKRGGLWKRFEVSSSGHGGSGHLI